MFRNINLVPFRLKSSVQVGYGTLTWFAIVAAAHLLDTGECQFDLKGLVVRDVGVDLRGC